MNQTDREGTMWRMDERMVRRWLRAMLLFLFPLATGCDLSVSNPGPTEDAILDGEGAHEAVVAGMDRVHADGLDAIARAVAYITGEVVWDGSAGLGSPNAQVREGILNEQSTNSEWQAAQRARWVAEDGVRRFREVLGGDFASYDLGAQALVYAGFGNRLLGENMCEAVIDGGGIEPRDAFFERAEAQFSEAIDIASATGQADVETAALAGRASVRVHLGDWAGAVSDAQQVPADFRHEQEYAFGDLTQFNSLAYSVADSISAIRSHTVYGTFFDDYYEETQDPRTPWGFDEDRPTADGGEFPFYYQRKYLGVGAPITVTSGAEARLIVAEGLLRDGDWTGALELVNERRSELDVPLWEGASAEEAWTALKQERRIEMWMEGRRLGDLRRWIADGTPGEMEDMSGQDLCFPVPQAERETNPNIPLSGS